MNREYIFNYKDYNIMIYNDNIYEEFYALRDINIFYALVNEKNDLKRNILEKNNKKIEYIKEHITIDCSLGYGICGLGYMYYFMQNVDNKYESEKEEIDNILIQLINKFIELKIPILDLKGNFNILYDYYRGITGVYAYFLQTSQNQDIKEVIIHDLLIKLSEINFKHLNNVNQTVAHGISVLLNLLRLNKSYAYTKYDIKIIKELMMYIQSNLEYKINSSDSLSLSWGNGDFGIISSILFLSKELNIKLSNEFWILLKLLIAKGNKEIFSKYNPCNGIYGYNRMMELIVHMYSFFTKDVEKEQLYTKKDKIKKCYKARNFSIIDGVLSELLIENTSQDKLDEYYKLFML